MSFNFIPATIEYTNEKEELPIIYELARNLKTLDLLTKDEKFYYVSKNDAIKIWILKVLNKQTSRYTYRAYSNNYGNEISPLFGRHLKKSLFKSELKRCIEEALLVNPYIKKISNLFLEQNGSKVKAVFAVTTVYGEFEQEFNYDYEE